MRRSPWIFTALRLVIVLTGTTTFLVSLTQVGVVVDGSDRGIERVNAYGWDLLMSGGFGVFDEPINLLLWPLVVTMWVLACRKRFAAALIAGLVVGALTWRYQDRGEVFIIAWLANPIIAVTWILYLRASRFAALISAVTALGLTLCFLSANGVPGPGPEGVNVADFETRAIISYGIGYWLWVASAAVLAAGVAADNIALGIMTNRHSPG
jgi:hypothetical protein